MAQRTGRAEKAGAGRVLQWPENAGRGARGYEMPERKDGQSRGEARGMKGAARSQWFTSVAVGMHAHRRRALASRRTN